jgi:hypothetical protein
MTTFKDTINQEMSINFLNHHKDDWVMLSIRNHKNERGHFYEMPIGSLKELYNQIGNIFESNCMSVQNNAPKWRLVATDKPYGKFVATYNDGSGSSIFQMISGKLYDAEGEAAPDEYLDEYLLWMPLPEDFVIWGPK